ncbi:putative heterokaryon incompatibility protein [Xylaria palmicola]|nr:putative heterokaryon incompatibility protein [Xylaria palmicola]
MPPEQQAVQGRDRLAAELAELPAGVRTMIAFLSVGLKASIFALRDTVLSKVGAWALSSIGLFGYYMPARTISNLFHLYLFFSGQSSWRRTAVTLRQLASREGADDESIAQLFLEASDLVVYVFMSLLFRNIRAVWGLFLSVSVPFLQFLVVAGPMWLIMIDNPIQTFNAEVARIWNVIRPKILTCGQVLGRFVATVLRHCVRLFGNIVTSIVARQERKTAARVATLDTYQHAALGSGEIRLLKVSKSTPWSPVRCELVPVRLDKTPLFETVSYTWGAQVALKPIIMNGGRFMVSERVYDIVHDRASCLMTRYLWIDSICINQRNEAEKSSQVQLMRKIYNSSFQTVIWLGYAPDANDAIGLLAHLQRRIDFDDPIERASRPLMELNIEHSGWPALTRLIKHDYWSRCWVIQEIAIARKVVILYGGELITWNYFFSLIQIMFNSDPNSVWHISKIYGRSPENRSGPIPMDAGLQIISIGHVRTTIDAKQTIGLFNLLLASINSTATDPRDNIYAVQGISTAADSGDITPDYTSTVERPFLKTAEYLLKQDYPSRILHLAGIGFHRSANIQTSWVPDWSTKRLSRIYWRGPLHSPYRASGTAHNEPDMVLSPNGLTLTLRGIEVDRIKQLGPQFFGASENGVVKTNVFLEVYDDYANSRNLVMNSALRGPYGTGISLAEALWRTLIGDRTPAGARPAESAFSEYYQALVRYIDVWRKLFGPDMQLLEPDIGAEEQARMTTAITKDLTDLGRFLNVSGAHVRERMVAVTERGYIGVVPPYSKVGDAVFIISGAQVPFLLRPQVDTEDTGVSSGGKWQLVGESYFHGMMDGEMVTERHAEQTVELC